MVLPLLSGEVDALGCSSPENWGVDITGAEGKEGAYDTPIPASSPQHSSHSACLSPSHLQESPRKERGDLGVPGPLSVAPASWILISCQSRETGSRG